MVRLLCQGGLGAAYTAVGLDPLAGDAYKRHTAYAFLKGASARTIVLLGHIDTVDTADFGAQEPWALDPMALSGRLDALVQRAPAAAHDLAAHPDDWLFGRGVIDMKSGVAANIAVMRHLAGLASAGTLPLSVVFLATPDEENESAGVLQAVRFLLRLRDEHGLTYLGAINTDYTTAQYPGDPHHYIYTGTIGKLLPSVLAVGRESHVGDPFDGLDANLLAAELIRDLSMNDALCDVVRGQVAPPPVTLHAADLKSTYDVQRADPLDDAGRPAGAATRGGAVGADTPVATPGRDGGQVAGGGWQGGARGQRFATARRGAHLRRAACRRGEASGCGGGGRCAE